MPIHDPIPDRFADGEAGCDAAAAASPAPKMTPAKLREWVRAAQPGARTVYARGTALALHAPPGVAKTARALFEGGFVRMHLKRPARGADMDYLIVRTAKPVLAGTVL